MNNTERFHATMNYEAVDRIPFWGFGAWPETIDRWKGEGYDPDKYDIYGGIDVSNVLGHLFFPNPPFEHEVLQEDETHILYVNHEGILMREMKQYAYSSMPQFVKFPVETREEFRKFWKERMQPDMSARLGEDWKEQLINLRAQESPLMICSDRWGGFFGPLRNLTGVESLCMLFYDDPAFIEEMMDADADFIIAMMGQILDVVPIDAYIFWEDMCYNAGPLLTPRLAREFMLPRYRRVAEFLKGRGVPWIGLDSDGKIDELIPVWMDAGIDYLYPFEVQCGMDVNRVRKEFGKDLRIVGGVNKRALIYGPESIDAEIERVRPLMEQGGYIPMTDHSIPPDVAFKDYQYYIKRMTEVCGGISRGI